MPYRSRYLGRNRLLGFLFHLINIAKLLELNYELIDEKEESFPLSLDEVEEARVEGYLCHPETGEHITSFADNIFSLNYIARWNAVDVEPKNFNNVYLDWLRKRLSNLN